MARKKRRTTRPFRSYDPDGPFPPGPLNLPQCGVGTDKQIDIHTSLFDVPASASALYFPELAGLTRKLNAMFQRDGVRSLRKRQKEWGKKSLQLTIAVSGGQLYLVYSVPKTRRRSR